MKKHPRHDRKLVVRQETVRTLDALALGHVAGGDPASALCPTRRFCPTVLCA